MVFSVNSVNAQEASPNWELSGRVRLVERFEDAPGKPAIATNRGQARIEGWIKISDSGCLKLKTRVTTGDGFNNDWFYTGIGHGEADLKIGIRHLYLDAECFAENVRVEGGAIPIRQSGSLGLTEYGWIDGSRITVSEPAGGRQWSLSVGEISDTKNPNLLTRQHSGINHAQLEVKQNVSSDGKTFVHASIAAQDSDVFTRAGIEWAVTEYIRWLRSVGGEVLLANDKVVGLLAFTNFDLGKWKMRAFGARLVEPENNQDKQARLLKNFYGYGDNIYLEANREIARDLTLNLRLRTGRAGQLGEVGVTKTFGVSGQD